MWFEKSVFYQIYPLGFCGAPQHNDGQTVPRIEKVAQWGEHMEKLGVDALYLSPIFDSDAHGYDTRDYRMPRAWRDWHTALKSALVPRRQSSFR